MSCLLYTSGITEPTAVAKLSGGFAEMDTDTCVVYSFGGAKLNSVQSGYALSLIHI